MEAAAAAAALAVLELPAAMCLQAYLLLQLLQEAYSLLKLIHLATYLESPRVRNVQLT